MLNCVNLHLPTISPQPPAWILIMQCNDSTLH